MCRGRQGGQDRLDDRRIYPVRAAEHCRAVDHRRAARHRTGRRVRGGWRATEGAAGGQRSGVGVPSAATLCEGEVGLSYIPPGTPWNNGYIESFNNRLGKECLNQPLEHPVRSLGGDRRLQTRAQSSTPPFGPELPNTGRLPGGLSNGDSPNASTVCRAVAHCLGPRILMRSSNMMESA